jgi:hypothetical protein
MLELYDVCTVVLSEVGLCSGLLSGSEYEAKIIHMADDLGRRSELIAVKINVRGWLGSGNGWCQFDCFFEAKYFASVNGAAVVDHNFYFLLFLCKYTNLFRSGKIYF